MKKAVTFTFTLFALAIPGGRSLATECQPAPSGVVHWWPGDGDMEDIAGGADGTLVNGTSFSTGLVDQAISFDGMDDAVNVGVPNRTLLTISFWVNPDAGIDPTTNVGAPAVFVDGAGHNADIWVNLGLTTAAFNNELVTLVDTLTQKRTGVIGTSPLLGWTHIALVWNSTAGRYDIYLNGVVQPVTSGTLTHVGLININNFRMGTHGSEPEFPDAFYDGLVDEVTVFDRILSAGEISAVFHAGSAGQCKGDSDADGILSLADNCPTVSNPGQSDGDRDGRGDECDCAPADLRAFASPPEIVNLLFRPDKQTLSWCSSSFVAGPGTVYDVVRGSIDELPVGLGVSETCLVDDQVGCPSPEEGLVHFWPGDATAADTIGGHNGTLVNGTSFATGVVDQAFNLDGVNDAVDIGDLNRNLLTASFWVNPLAGIDPAVGAGAPIVFADGAGHNNDFWIALGPTTGAVANEIVTLVDTLNNRRTAVTGGPIRGSTHIALAWNSTAGRYDIYFNGVGQLVTSGTSTHVGLIDVTIFRMGTHTSQPQFPDVFYAGLLDEVTIHDRTLAAGEICATSLTDDETPASGGGFWYLVRGGNPCDVGTYGLASNTVERSTPACP